jgi:hypothetical protein
MPDDISLPEPSLTDVISLIEEYPYKDDEIHFNSELYRRSTYAL